MNASADSTNDQQCNTSHNTFYGTHGNLNPVISTNISVSQPKLSNSIKSKNSDNQDNASQSTKSLTTIRSFDKKVGYPRRSTYNRFHMTNNDIIYKTTQERESFPENIFEQLNKQGYLNGISKDLCRNMLEFPLRVWVVDNSGSMNIKDGHKFELNNKMDVTRCSRWEELQETVIYHAGLASLLHAPTIFRLLNASEGTDELTIATKEKENTPQELKEIKDVMQSLKPAGLTPLTKHVYEIKDIIQSLTENEELYGEDNSRIAIILATDGLPSNNCGQSGINEQKEFMEALRSLEGLPVWIVVRLCTDDEEVVAFYNELDAKLELSIEVLDDFESEAKEISKHNPWLNYTLPLHRIRELGYHHRLFDLLDERLLTIGELQQFCHLLLDIDQNSPDAEVDWNGFLKHVSKIVEMERKEYDPIKRKLKHVLDLKKLNKLYGDNSWWKRKI